MVPLDAADPAAAATGPAAIATAWVTEPQGPPPTAGATPSPPLVAVPLYGCHVVWAAGRGAVLGPSDRLPHLRASLAEFAVREADLRDVEQRTSALVDAAEADAGLAFTPGDRCLERQVDLAARYRETIGLRRRLALLAPAVHAPPVHPPTLASQLAERLRDRTRLPDRLELVTERIEIAGDVYEACGQRAGELGIAHRQNRLEWAIVVLLVIQTALIVVELLSWSTAS